MDLRTLRCCEAIARLGSLTRAAEELHVAQPAISVAVRKLEAELGVTLFVRHANRRVTPTAEGRILVARAERLFREVDSARREIADSVELKSGEVRIGVPPMFGAVLLPPRLAAFHAAYPGVGVSAVEGSAGEIGARLDDGGIDLAVLEERRIRAGWQHEPIGEHEIVIAVPRAHPLAGRGRIADADLDGLAMAVFDETFLQRNVLDQRARRAQARYRTVMQSNSVALVREAAAAGLGAATLLRTMAEADPRLAALAFDPPEVFRFGLCWLGERYLSRASRALIGFLRG